MTRALIVGRFQPFHNGHLEAVRRVAAASERVTLGIGSANVSHTRENPFTAGERYEMIRAALDDAGIRNADVVPIPDVNRNALWVAHVRSLVPPFDTFYTNNPLPKRLFEEAGFAVRPLPFVERGRYEGTRIRAIMAEGGDWEAHVPAAVRSLVKEFRGVERLRDLLARDTQGPG